MSHYKITKRRKFEHFMERINLILRNTVFSLAVLHPDKNGYRKEASSYIFSIIL